MPKFLITWDAGYGQSEEVIEAETLSDAQSEAFGRWHDEAQSNAEYEATPFTEELAEQYGFDWDEEE